MGTGIRYPKELRERAAMLVAESINDQESEWAATNSVAAFLALLRYAVFLERMTNEMGVSGAVRGRTKNTTMSDKTQPRPPDLVNRQFFAALPAGSGVGVWHRP